MKNFLKGLQFHIVCMVAWYMYWVLIYPNAWLNWKFTNLIDRLDTLVVHATEDWLSRNRLPGEEFPISGIMYNPDDDDWDDKWPCSC